VHGWFYGLFNGLLQDLKMTVSGPDEMHETYERAIAAVHGRYPSHDGPEGGKDSRGGPSSPREPG